MKPIPKAAMPVVRILRRDVPRPPLPVPDREIGARWAGAVFTFTLHRPRITAVCPMGLHRKALLSLPYHKGDFPAHWRAIRSFALWWDKNTRDVAGVQRAMDAIWPKERKL